VRGAPNSRTVYILHECPKKARPICRFSRNKIKIDRKKEIIMKKILPFAFFLVFMLTACDGWSYTVPTFPAPPPTITPSIFTVTPVIVTITNTSSPVFATETPTLTALPLTPTETATAFTEAPPPTNTATLPPVSPNVIVGVLGCNTSIDITHSMGEVTNAYVTLKNNTGLNLPNLCTTLNARDEGRVHPDKTVCIPLLANGQQVTLKLTVDSTYKVETPIQIEVKSGGNLLSRVGQDSCTDIGIFAPGPGALLTPVPIQ
jgi:hypothetical protein